MADSVLFVMQQTMAPYSAFAPPAFLGPQGFQLASVPAGLPIFRAIDTAQAAERGVEPQIPLGRVSSSPAIYSDSNIF